jgi:hypothetical protein
MPRSRSSWSSIAAVVWAPKLQKSRQAAAQFFKLANPEDEFFLVQFNDRPALAAGFTHSTEENPERPYLYQSKGARAAGCDTTSR